MSSIQEPDYEKKLIDVKEDSAIAIGQGRTMFAFTILILKIWDYRRLV